MKTLAIFLVTLSLTCSCTVWKEVPQPLSAKIKIGKTYRVTTQDLGTIDVTVNKVEKDTLWGYQIVDHLPDLKTIPVSQIERLEMEKLHAGKVLGVTAIAFVLWAIWFRI